jgi:Site-specific recombinase XerD
MEAITRLDAFLTSVQRPRLVAVLHRPDIEAFIAAILATQSPATASNRYRALGSFFRWAVEDGEIDESPMAKMQPPRVPEAPVPILSSDALTRLLKSCEGTDFRDRRDLAIIRLFLDTGMRRGELAGLSVDDVDLKERTARVLGKGRKVRLVRFTAKTAQAIDRYLRRARATHRDAGSPALWLGAGGRMTGNGIYQVITSRAEEAGIGPIHPHQFRHTFAHTQLAKGMQEGDLAHLAGWSSTQMLRRYGASAAAERAREAYDRLNRGDEP